jgi:hypothetical protein
MEKTEEELLKEKEDAHKLSKVSQILSDNLRAKIHNQNPTKKLNLTTLIF